MPYYMVFFGHVIYTVWKPVWKNTLWEYVSTSKKQRGRQAETDYLLYRKTANSTAECTTRTCNQGPKTAKNEQPSSPATLHAGAHWVSSSNREARITPSSESPIILHVTQHVRTSGPTVYPITKRLPGCSWRFVINSNFKSERPFWMLSNGPTAPIQVAELWLSSESTGLQEFMYNVQNMSCTFWPQNQNQYIIPIYLTAKSEAAWCTSWHPLQHLASNAVGKPPGFEVNMVLPGLLLKIIPARHAKAAWWGEQTAQVSTKIGNKGRESFQDLFDHWALQRDMNCMEGPCDKIRLALEDLCAKIQKEVSLEICMKGLYTLY